METYAEKFICRESCSDLDLEWPFYGDTDRDDRNEVLTSSNVDADVPSLSITALENILAGFKKLGADRIYITTNCDHQGYQFYGVKLIKI